MQNDTVNYIYVYISKGDSIAVSQMRQKFKIDTTLLCNTCKVLILYALKHRLECLKLLVFYNKLSGNIYNISYFNSQFLYYLLMHVSKVFF